ncbi:odorant receptor Or2 [Orussus abietinus]|uniref:odorant receptor Or2 n=1 Tax=Orussus abietinus TaxID=222816 RepID=UPI000C715C70|nr:odorant receptor Or2 [Orussus abietinus]
MNCTFSVMVIALFLSIVIEGMDLYYSRGNFYDAIYITSNLVVVIMVMSKLVMLTIQRGAIINLIQYTERNIWQMDCDEQEDSILKKCDRKGILLMCTFVFFDHVTFLGFVTRPAFESMKENGTERVLPYDIWFDMPTTITPYYEMLFALEVLNTYVVAICYFCFDNFLCLLNIFATGQFRILQRRLETVCDVDEITDSKSMIDDNRKSFVPFVRGNKFSKLKECIRLHQNMIRYVEEVKAIFQNVILIHVLLSSINVCLVLFQVVADQNSATRRVTFTVHIIGTFCQLFSFALTCDEIIQESLHVADAAYNVKWHDSSVIDKKLATYLQIIIIRARRSCSLTGAGFFSVSLETFTKILSTSLSYFTILRQSEAYVSLHA